MTKLLKISTLLAISLVSQSALQAQELAYSGHLKYQVGANRYALQTPQDSVGPRTFTTHDLDFRANTDYTSENWFAAVNAEVLSIGGQGVKTNNKLKQSGVAQRPLLISDDRRLFDLTVESIDEKHFASVARLDRINVGYKTDNASVVFGRQAITWGGGLTFHVFDLFNPFSPTAIDKEYKTGDDMLYGQSLIGHNSEIQTLYIPRRDESQALHAEESSAAMLWRTTLTNWEVSALGARHYDENIFGVGANRSLFEAVFRADIILESSQSSSNEVSFVLNADRSWTILETNIYGFVEYFHTGFGGKTDSAFDINQQLQEKINRGESYTIGKDYISWGGKIELQPLLELYLLHIANLHDESGLVQVRLVDDQIAQDLRLQIGGNIPYGAHGSEFGGIKLPGEQFLTPPEQLFARLSYYL